LEGIQLPHFAVFDIRRIADDDNEAAAVEDAVELDKPVERFVVFLPRVELLLVL